MPSDCPNYTHGETYSNEFNFPKVELHLHFGGCLRAKTAFHYAKLRGIDLGFKSHHEIENFITIDRPFSLPEFVVMYDKVITSIVGHRDALIQAAYELVEEKVNEGVVYLEVRYSPHLYATYVPDRRTWEDALGDFPLNDYKDFHSSQHNCMDAEKYGLFTPEDAILCITEGFNRAEKEFNIKVRSILCCIRPHPSWSYEVVQLANKYKHLGIVGIDLCADETIPSSTIFWGHVKAYQEAERLGINRTVHAAQSSPAEDARQALNVLKANRIGHGYLVLNDDELYQKCLNENIHFELCPSVFNIAQTKYKLKYNIHPIEKFCKDNANWSINTDDPAYFKKHSDLNINSYKNLESQSMISNDLILMQQKHHSYPMMKN